MQPQIQRMENAPGGGNSEVLFQMDVVVPHQCGNAVATLQSRRRKTLGQLARAQTQVAESLAMQGPALQSRNNLCPTEVFARTLQNGRKRERIIHHGMTGWVGHGRPFYTHTDARRCVLAETSRDIDRSQAAARDAARPGELICK